MTEGIIPDLLQISRAFFTNDKIYLPVMYIYNP